uniref:Dynein axonemal heavy chain 1 n=1 Tax=Anser cygnoides TaxID=8845 RepID=A0A8B9ENZ5_ANSCY
MEETTTFRKFLKTTSSRAIVVDVFLFLSLKACQVVAMEFRDKIEEFRLYIPLIQGLHNPGMRKRHWEMLSEAINIDIKLEPDLTLRRCLDMNLLDHIESITKVAEIAGKEYAIENVLNKMENEWSSVSFTVSLYKDTGTFILKNTDEASQLLDDHIVMIQSMSFSPFKKAFEDRMNTWENKLKMTQVLEWLKCQCSWLYLEPIFRSEDIKRQLPVESERYHAMDMDWRIIMKNANENPEVMSLCPDPALLENLQKCNKLLELVQKRLSEYLETKRGAFPRFYFLSDDELLEILSQTKDPTAVQPHLRKCFENIAQLQFQEDLQITHMYSAEGEEVKLFAPIYPTDSVEDWLLEVEKSMKASIRDNIERSIGVYPEMSRTTWVLQWPGQVTIAGCQIFWTKEVSEALEAGDLSKCFPFLIQLGDLVAVVRGKLSKMQRAVLSALIVIEVHAKDVAAKLIEENVTSVNDFEWISQLRYYWTRGDLYIRAVNAEFMYGYEYLGNSGRLVITPLTDRCYLTLTGALHLKFGGAPAGPAGTGKTETTKDLGKALAIQTVVFNCSDQLDFMAMGKFFKGLASSGAWACFDEFNRIDIEVLSVVAQQITTIQKAQQQRVDRFMFEGMEIPLVPSCAVFITMNPGYAGRTELPDNLKALFRPVAMMVPDYSMIAEISLYSFGFNEAKVLAKKITTTFKLLSEQLSTQDHYDFGMRAVKTVISTAGNLKRENPTMDEDLICLRAIRDANIPKFLQDDLKLFNGIVSDLFPKIKEKPVDYGILEEAIRKACIEKNLKDADGFVTKCIQLYETTVVRHGLMLVGPTGSGKTKVWHLLAITLSFTMFPFSLGGNYEAVSYFVLNPKSITMGQLYGEFNLLTHEWTDGILSSLIRRGAMAADARKKWYMFDGPVDALWIENMNTVLDDNKKLCLSSGEIIKMTESMTMMFEVQDLAVASPATVSRCGMVYLEPSILGLEPFTECWLQKIPGVMQILLLLSSISQGIRKIPQEKAARIRELIEPWFIFALIWSVGATGDSQGRVAFSMWLREKMAKEKVSKRKVLCIGPTGTGKTLTITDKLLKNLPLKYVTHFLMFSARTSANQTQDLIDSKLDKRRKGVFGPPVGRYFIFFIDDLNMPMPEAYGAQPPIELLRQWLDHQGWYDRKQIGTTQIFLVDINFVCAMGPPGGGRNAVTPRLTRHFNYLSFTEMEDSSKKTIFSTILGTGAPAVKDLNEPLVDATICVYSTITSQLLPTPAKSHYTFNLRDLSKVFQGMLMAESSNIEDKSHLLRLWYHESCRVFSDRLVTKEDQTWFDNLMKSMMEELGTTFEEVVPSQPVLFGDFMERDAHIRLYKEINSQEKDYLEEYNQTHTTELRLELFMDAVQHICRISRILRQAPGNALLLGVGGSGRQSLTRLASHMADYECFQIELSKNYDMTEWRDDMKKIMMKADTVKERITNINNYITFSLYSNVCRSLFEKHKLMFAFLLCARILMNDGQIDMEEWRYLLSGGAIKEMRENPAPDWLCERAWGDILALSNLKNFSGFADDFAANLQAFRAIFDSPEPHREPLPQKWDARLDAFQRLLILRCLRGDKITNAMQDFVALNLDQTFIEPQVPTTDLSVVFRESSATTPLVFVLSPGTDPAADLYKFAEEMKFSKKLSAISLGQGQGPRAEAMMHSAMEQGNWVFFQNCHLAPSWMPSLERLIEGINPNKVTPTPWLRKTFVPTPHNRVALLPSKQFAVPPWDLLLQSQQELTSSNNISSQAEHLFSLLLFPQVTEFKSLLLSLCFFHGNMLERRKFGPLGFNIPYEFTDGDLRICISQLEMFLSEYTDIPYKVLKYTAGEINYGGRVTDDWDRRCIMNILEDFYKPEVLIPEFAYSESGIYKQINTSSDLNYIRSLPLNDSPELFGLHENANITFAQKETFALLGAIMQLQPKMLTLGGRSREELVEETSRDILAKLPAPMDLQEVIRKYPLLYEESMNTVLVQELFLCRYNGLLEVIAQTLKDLLKALKGLVVMSSQLELMANSLYNNAVPAMWNTKAYPSLKPLASWVNDLVQRIEFLKKWINHGIPSVFWISGFFFPQAFLTGTLQNFARKSVISIDTISFSFKVSEALSRPPAEGCYIHGLFLEGARWDPSAFQLAESRPKELYTEMAVIWLLPVPSRKPPANGIYLCPIYKTLTRAGTLSTTGHSTNYVIAVELPTDKPQQHWIRRGTALICSLDF